MSSTTVRCTSSVTFAAVALLISTAHAMNTQIGSFEEYIAHYGRSYVPASLDYKERSTLFAKRLALITSHNEQEGRTWTAGLNALSDRTEKELLQLRGYRPSKSKAAALMGANMERTSNSSIELPETMDWTTLKMALRVPDQAQCGSCWAVATASMLEARYEVHTGKSRTFSAQQLVNCVPNPKDCGGSGGCDGATVELAMKYIVNAGLKDNDGVPYEGTDGTCEYPMKRTSSSFLSRGLGLDKTRSSGADSIGLTSWETLPSNQARPLYEALLDGPVAIALSADQWFLYDRGIINSCEKDIVVDHAVTVFGYGVGTLGNERGIKFWNIRNSWGEAWGEGGFVRMQRLDTPELEESYCGTDPDPSMGVACKPYPTTQRVCGMCGMLLDIVAVTFHN